MEQCETKNIASRSDRYVLDSLDRITHRRSAHDLSRIEMPKWPAGFCFHCLEGFRIVAEEHESARRCQCAPPRPAWDLLRVAPKSRSNPQRKLQLNFPETLPRGKNCAGVIEGLALHE